MAHQLTAPRHEGAVYLPTAPESRTEDMGERLACAVRSIAEVRTIAEEAFAVRAYPGTSNCEPGEGGRFGR